MLKVGISCEQRCSLDMYGVPMWSQVSFGGKFKTNARIVIANFK